MKRKLLSKKVFALILAVAMLVTIIPMTALAGDATPAAEQTEYVDDNAASEAVDAQAGDDVVEAVTQEVATEAPTQAEPETQAPETVAAEPETQAPETTAAPEPETKQEETTAAEPETKQEETTAADPEKKQEETTAAKPEKQEETTKKDTSEEETTEEETTEAEEDKMPAQSFNGSANGVYVDVKAPEGAFPANTRMRVTGVADAAVIDAVEGALNEEVSNLKAVDITFYNKEGIEIQPEKDIRVVLRVPEMTAAVEHDVVHIDDYGNADVLGNASISGNKAVFDTSNFSVYVVVESIVPRLTVTFKNGDTEIATMYVKAADTAAEVDKIVYDPGAGDVPKGQIFKGWTTEQNYTAETKLYTIKEVRSQIMDTAAGLTGDASVTYYAAIYTQIAVSYIDENGVTITTEAKEIPGKEGTVSYEVNQGYSTDDQHNFEGWLVSEGLSNIVDPSGATADTVFPNGTEITIKGDVAFSVSAPEGHWLVFDENGKGATYNAPRFIKSGETTSDEGLLEMVRKGYTFDGWYTDKECSEGNEFTFGGTIDDTTTIYAKWKAAATATYSVIIWKQKVTGDGYDFEEAVNLTGNVGSTINTVVQNGSSVNTGTTPATANNVRVNGSEKAYTGFHCDHFDTNKTIVAEGTTVLNVYYNRNTITINYDAGNGRYILDENDNTYKRRVTYTGLYEAPLTFTWPTTYYTNAQGGGEANTLWQYGNTVLTFIGSFKLPNPSDVVINMTRADTGNYPRRFIQQNVDGTWPTTAHDTINTTRGNFSITDKYTGFTAYQYRTNTSRTATTGWSNWTSCGTPNASGVYVTVNDPGQLEVRYARVKNKITYLDGATYDGNNSKIEESSHGELGQSEDIFYGADVTSYAKGGDDYFEPDAQDGYVFEGWYADEGCTVAYTFSTMPAEGITVYAKWRQIQYRVFLHPNAGTDPTLDWGSESQEMNFRVTIGGKISAPDGLRKGYEFYGWYTDAGLSKTFAPATVLNESTVTTPYDKTVDMTDPMDKWGNGATTNNDTDRFWITKKYDLYAKWVEVTIGAKGIGIIYDANGGTNAPTDTALYINTADVSAGAASKAPAKKVFKQWVVQKWNGSAFEDTDVVVLPGETFTALKNNARITDLQTGEVVALEDVQEGGKYDYTIQVRAEYTDLEEETPTHIDWYSNYGSENDGKGTLYHSDTNIKINEAVDILGAQTREGYVFKGWTKTKGGTTADFLIYTGSGYTDVNGNAATQVAADEKQPYEDLFAVWQPKLAVRITGNEDTKTYNGAEQSVTGYTAEYKVGDGDWTTTTPEGVTVALADGKAAEAKGTDVDEYDMGLAADTFNVTADNYVFDPSTDLEIVKDGKLTIEPAELTITAQDKEFTYTGEAQSWPEYDVTGLKGNDAIKVTVTGSITFPSESPVTNKVDSYEFTTGKASNYTVKTEDGKLTMKNASVEITIKAADDEQVYDGTALTNDEVTVTEGELLEGDELVATATGSATYVSDTEEGNNPVATGYKIMHGDKDVTENYKITAEAGTLTITPAKLIITANSDTKVYDAKPLTNDGYTDSGLAAADDKIDSVTVTGSQTVVGKSDNVPSKAKIVNKDGKDITTSYDIEYKNGTLEVTKNTSAVITADSDTKIYDGKALTKDTYQAAGLAEGDKVESCTVTGSQTIVGTSDNVPSNAKIVNKDGEDVTESYEVKYQNGTLEVTEKSLTITADSDKKVYDGKELTKDSYTDSGLATGDKFDSVTVTGSQLDVGKSDNVPSAAKIVNGDGEDVTACYKITYKNGTLEVTLRKVTLTSESATKEYDGTALEKPVVKESGDGFVEGEVTDLKATGSIIKVGKVTNTIEYTEGDTFKADNYEITKNEGTLEITKNTSAIEAKAGDAKKKYDGKELTCEDVEVTGMPDSFTYEATTNGKITDAGEKANKIKTFKILDKDGKDVTDQFANIKKTDGTLTVTKRKVTLTSASDEKAYDGTPLTNDEITVSGDGWAEGEGADFFVDGSQTYVGSSDNTFKYQLYGGTKLLSFLSAEDNATTKEGNYNITKEYGTLTVTDEGADPAVKTHDGKEYGLGDVVEFEITVENIYDENKTITITEQEGVTITSQSVFKNVKPGEKVTATAEYTITEKDIRRGSFTNKATVTFSGVDKPYEPEDTVDTGDPDPHITIVKTTTSKPKNGKTYALGEEITYKITVKNDGNLTVKNIEVEDELTGDSWTIDRLKPGANKVFTASYVVTEDDILAGSVVNEVTGKADDDVPVKPGKTEDPTDPKNSHLTTVKTVTSTPKNGKAYETGEMISFQIKVTNDGNMTIKDITVDDPLTGDNWTIKTLKPGEEKTFKATYKVTEADAKKGKVKNVVTVKGTDPEDEEVPSEDVVEVPVQESKVPVTPKTGDNNNMYLWLAVLLLSGGLMGSTVLTRRVRRKEDE